MARRTALRQRQTPALRPIDGKETRRRQIDRGHDGARWNLGNRIGPRESRQDAVANIPQIGGAGPKVFIVRGFVTGSFRFHRLAPGIVRGAAFRDRGERRLGQHVVLEQRDLEGKDVGGLAGRLLDEPPQVAQRLRQRRAQRPGLDIHRT